MYHHSQIKHVSKFFKVLSDENRLRMMLLLLEEPCSVGHISHTLKLSQSAVSHQLKLMREHHLVIGNRSGKSMIYEISDHHVKTLINQTFTHLNHSEWEVDDNE
ncbi:ArsR/SmtB family transcription factor [Staphylococcus massiliensis]|uniref:Repressor protein n=1 Tax=Staphylococcus massiliensis S46 TaxID=1229783 RepID=K9AEJ7_9STAP|nr:metalloregulator ArsR/SmtB family transcription factor [Staphylococcus massiliensis]EKU45703.1 repressor protein [Staphylococcus massiliensis S46]MCG3400212.1 metalloregulator ArsR/SmtB family transcription factor [Staphylococcus massiliensis]MCG3402779.1 metalloregulator ArsR/SmtB family transcription factor [Staphylococcus massiliensis]MCG3413229.1 metalloregulator ArsR/SmtB family transcription factor [Staphylococcus massiliensis]PNZ96898.1 transcriptional regulator [Staphylococcus massi